MFIIGPGDSPTKFIVHKEHACYHSLILDAAFNGKFNKWQTQTYRIEDTSPGAFRFFVQWVYRQELDLVQLVEEEVAVEKARTEDMELAELWVLADKMAMPDLQSFVISKIIELRVATGEVPTWTISYIYQRTAIDSPLRSLMVSEVAHHYCHSGFSFEAENFPHAFLIDLARELMILREKDAKKKS